LLIVVAYHECVRKSARSNSIPRPNGAALRRQLIGALVSSLRFWHFVCYWQRGLATEGLL